MSLDFLPPLKSMKKHYFVRDGKLYKNALLADREEMTDDQSKMMLVALSIFIIAIIFAI